MMRLSTSLLLSVIVLGISAPCWAWGPDAKRTIAMAARQLIRNETSEAFTAEGVSYEVDMIRGVSDGYEIVAHSSPLGSDLQVLDAIERQIQLLRAARSEGTGSNFAYRMGVLAALTADIVHPYGVIYSEDDQRMKERVEADMDRNISSFRYSPAEFRVQYIRSPRLYFEKHRPFFDDDKKLIVDDYKRGKGYSGFLRKGANAYYARSIEAVVNVWFSVFYGGAEAVNRRPSDIILSDYYTQEIGFLLRVKDNPKAASRAYKLFEKSQSDDKQTYITIGDMFYEYGEDLLAGGDASKETLGEEMRQRGVHEWSNAQRSSGEVRRAASTRMSRHYIREGEAYFQRSIGAMALETDLADAKRSFELAVKVDRTNVTAVERISETSLAIKKKEERYTVQQDFLEKSLEVMQEAQKSELQEEFGAAINAYNRALVILSTIDTEFKDLNRSAEENTSNVKKFRKTVIQKVLDKASNAMEQGADAQLEKQFDTAVNHFKRVPVILDDIPEQAGPVVEESKRQMIEESKDLILDAESAKKRFEANQNKPVVAPLGGNK